MAPAAAVIGGLRWQARGTPIEAGFSYDVDSYALSRAGTARLGGPLTAGEVATSYEYPYSRRVSQYYGELHWSIARGQLQEKIGR